MDSSMAQKPKPNGPFGTSIQLKPYLAGLLTFGDLKFPLKSHFHLNVD
jgi:hypothetical protein